MWLANSAQINTNCCTAAVYISCSRLQFAAMYLATRERRQRLLIFGCLIFFVVISQTAQMCTAVYGSLGSALAQSAVGISNYLNTLSGGVWLGAVCCGRYPSVCCSAGTPCAGGIDSFPRFVCEYIVYFYTIYIHARSVGFRVWCVLFWHGVFILASLLDMQSLLVFLLWVKLLCVTSFVWRVFFYFIYYQYLFRDFTFLQCTCT